MPIFDADGDGRITLAEVIDKPNPAFALLDTNHDCVITPEERRGTGTDSGGQTKARIELTIFEAQQSLTDRRHGCHNQGQSCASRVTIPVPREPAPAH